MSSLPPRYRVIEVTEFHDYGHFLAQALQPSSVFAITAPQQEFQLTERSSEMVSITGGLEHGDQLSIATEVPANTRQQSLVVSYQGPIESVRMDGPYS